MTDVDLNFLARKLDQVLTEIGSMRDEMRIQAAIIMRVDHSGDRREQLLADILNELRATHAQITRLTDRIRKVEDAQP